MASLGASSQVLQKKYDVFISFRGLDIRPTFLSHLKKQLQQEEIDVYVDEMLERGDKISTALLEAIESSIIALVIFSKDYASSWWCLEELVKIMECKRVNNQIVIPVFYNVDPSHVRHQEGSYGDAFAQHEQKYNHDLMKLWKFVLESTANLSGYHSSNYFNESDLIGDIVKNVSKKLEDKNIIEPKDQLIGCQKDMTTIESFMKVDSEEVRVIGIWGKGGIGKTTLAQVVFDKYSPRYNSSCFVSNVREESKRIGLIGLLEKILFVLLNNENLTHKRRPNTQRRLSWRKAFLVLDDVDSSGQLHYLIEENISLGPNSKIIITSRDKHVLISGGVHEVHEMKELCMEESLQLFCWYAFKQDHRKIGYEKLSMQAIEYARGLPLALKVLGSYLNSRDTKAWESALKKLRKHPNPEIYNVLRVSYDGLDILEKRIFLDIAFFLLGKKKELIISVLDACGDLYADCGIDDLINKALITISSDNIVGMHDLLQEMAEEIVREESRKHPERRSRLNGSKEIQHILKNSMGTDAIEGIILKLEESEFLSANAFKNLSNLRILKIQPCVPIVGGKLYFRNGLDSLSDKLSYIYWDGYPLASLPMGFCAEKLVEIHMPFSKVEKLWDDVQNLMNLKTINLSRSFHLVKLPDLSMAQNLEMVELQFCIRLCSIHPSILSLPKLSYLDLTRCNKLKILHGDKHMKSLKYLMLSHCTRLVEFFISTKELRRLNLVLTSIKTLKLPIGQFNKLEELYLSGCLKSFQINELSYLTSLKIFSLSNFNGRLIRKSNLLTLFDVWRSLDELHLTHCEVYLIPDNISGMSLLRTLSLRGCPVEGLPNSIKHLSKLKQLDLGKCKQLRSLPELPSSITHFYVDECTSLETIDFKVMRAIYNKYSGEVKVCYPGSTIPKGFKYSRTGERFITVELPASSSDHLLGFASCCVLDLSGLIDVNAWIYRKLHLEDAEIYCDDDEKFFPFLDKRNGCNVYLWYDPIESILKKTQRSFDGGTTYKFTWEFFVGVGVDVRCDHHGINECGIWPIYASDLQEEVVQQMELKLENRTAKRKRNSFNFFDKLSCSVDATMGSIQDAHTRFFTGPGGQGKTVEHVTPWKPPPAGWVKVNTDGAFSRWHHGAGVACGGVVRDDHGNLLKGFMFKGMEGDSLSAELWGCLHGLKLAWDLGHRQVMLESDSTDVVDLLKNGVHELHADWSVIKEIRCLMERDWRLEVDHVNRWANSAADHVARAALSAMTGFHVVMATDGALNSLIDKDKR